MTLATDQKQETKAAAPHLRYRPEIDGLRAWAVLAVLFYHAGFGLPGGYIGVDLFFVISGFLITSIIVRDCERGQFRFREFWERRVRRIAPALYVMVGATLILGSFLALSKDYKAYSLSTLWQLVFGANFHFWRTSNYFGTNDDPLLHTWSLAVEEQFYFVLPLLIFVVYRLIRSRSALLGLFAAFSVTSLWLAASYVHDGDRMDAFFLLPSRAWELLLGSMLAVLPVGWIPQRRSIREGAAWLGVVSIALPMFLYGDRTLFPGVAALWPCAGAALLIWSQLADEETPTSVGRVLSWKPMVGIGLISYSLYLWHWPVWTYGNYWSFEGEASWAFRWGAVLVSLLLGWLSWRWIETPFRKRTVCASRRSLFTAFGVSTGVLAAAAAAVVGFNGMPERLAEQPERHREIYSGRSKVTFDHLFRLTDERVGEPAQLLLFGDSHAYHAGKAVDELCGRLKLKGALAESAATCPLLEEDETPSFLEDRKQFRFRKRVADYIKRHRAKLTDVILLARWSLYDDEIGFEEAFRETVEKLDGMGLRVWVMLQPPEPHRNVPVYLIRSLYLDEQPSILQWMKTVEEHAEEQAVMYRLAESGLPATFIDPAPAFRIPGTEVYRVEEEGVAIYRDNNHIRPGYASKYLLPPLLKAMQKNR